MYKDVKKKLLAVVLCICMVIGAVEIAPRVKAETKTVTGSVSGTPVTITYAVDNTTLLYNGNPQLPTLTIYSVKFDDGTSYTGSTDVLHLEGTGGTPLDGGTNKGNYTCHIVGDKNRWNLSETTINYEILGLSISDIKATVKTTSAVMAYQGNGKAVYPDKNDIEVRASVNGEYDVLLDPSVYSVTGTASACGIAYCNVTVDDTNYVGDNFTVSATYRIAYDMGTTTDKFRASVDGTNIFYAANMTMPQVTFNVDGTTIDNVQNLTAYFKVEYYKQDTDNKENYTKVDGAVSSAGNYQVRISPINAYVDYKVDTTQFYFIGTYTADFKVLAKTATDLRVTALDDQGNEVRLSDDEQLEMKYTGSPVKPTIVIEAPREGTTPAVYDKVTDSWDIAYPQASGAGYATIQITPKPGMTNYEDKTITYPYYIKSGIYVDSFGFGGIYDVGDNQLQYDGKDHTLNTCVVKNSANEPLTLTEDYTISYEYSTDNGVTYLPATKADRKSVGKKRVAIKGADSNIAYKNQIAYISYEILPVDITNGTKYAKNVNIKFIESSWQYTGKEIQPEFEFWYNGVLIGKSSESAEMKSQISYENNVNAGSTAKVKLKGWGNFTGTYTKEFAISQLSIGSIKYKDNITYTGSGTTPELTIDTYVLNSNPAQKDYEILYYDNDEKMTTAPSEVGEHSVTVNIVNTNNINCAGNTQRKYKYSIVAKSINELDIHLDPEDVNSSGEISWNGGSTKPGIIVPDELQGKENVYYSVKYENYDRVSTVTDASITITGKGNYTDTKVLRYKITRRVITASDEFSYQVEASEDIAPPYTLTVNLTDYNRKVGEQQLQAGRDYEIKYVSYYNEQTEKWVTLTSGSEYTASGNQVSGLTRAGRYKVTISGIGDYLSSTLTNETSPTSCGVDLSSYVPHIEDEETEYTYTGASITPAAISLYKNINTPDTTVPADGYTISYVRENGETDTKKIGRVYVIITGDPTKGYFGKTSQLNVSKAYYDIISPVWSTSNPLTVLVVTKGGISYAPNDMTEKPEVIVSFGAIGLKANRDYKVTYPTDWATAGKYKIITITGMGNYENPKNVWYAQYDVLPIDINRLETNTTTIDYVNGATSFKLKFGNYFLVEGADKDYTYEAKIVSGSTIYWNEAIQSYQTTYMVVGKNNFTGEREITVNVRKSSLDVKNGVVFAKSKEEAKPGEYYVTWSEEEMYVDKPDQEITRRDKCKPERFEVNYKTETGSVPLKRGTDYQILTGDDDYGTNATPGYSENNFLTIEGMGGYSGKRVICFTLYSDLSKVKLAPISILQESTGATPVAIAKSKWKAAYESSADEDKSNALVTLQTLYTKEGGYIDPSEYTLAWPKDLNLADPAVGTYTMSIVGNEAGKEGPHYYRGTRDVTFTIVNGIETAEIHVNSNDSVQYMGEPATVTGAATSFTVTVEGVKLTLNKDYIITGYENNTQIGTATVKIEGIGSYKGEAQGEFLVTYPLGKLGVQMQDANGTWKDIAGGANVSFKYNHEEKTPLIRMYLKDYDPDCDAPFYQSGGYFETEYLNNLNAGMATVRVKNCPYFTSDLGYRDLSFAITSTNICPPTKGAITYSPITAVNGNLSIPYTGKDITVEDLKLELNDGGYPLVKDTDYVVFYKNDNQNVSVRGSEPVVSVKGIGNYEGEYSFAYNITPKSINDGITVQPITVTYAGGNIDAAVRQQLSVVQDDIKKNLACGTDYEIEAYYLDQYGYSLVTGDNGIPNAKGTYYAKISGKGNYSDVRFVQIIVTQKDMSEGMTISYTDSDHCKVSLGVPQCVYDGTPHEPEIVVTYGANVTLTPNKDYTVKYENNLKAGTATVIVTGAGNFSGETTATFEIAPKKIDDASIYFSPIEENYPFKDGESVEPDQIQVKDTLLNNYLLLNGIDYQIDYLSEYDELERQQGANLHSYAGQVTMTITGLGDYTGTKEFTYYIGEDISKLYAMVDGQRKVSTTYNGLAQAPAENRIGVGGVTADLVEPDGTKRYDIAFYKGGFDNKVTSDQMINADTYYVSVIGVPSKGTYAKSSESNSCIYTIQPRSIAQSYILVSGYDSSYYYTGQPIHPNGIVVEDTDLPVSNNAGDPQRRSVKLIANTDYVIDYNSGNCTYAGKASFAVNGTGNYTGTRVAYFNIISSNMSGNNTSDGTSEGTGSLTNGSTTIAASDIILGFDNSTYECMMYNGYPRTPNVTINGVSTSDFIVTASNNIRPGVATLTIQGTGNNFTGTITKNYTIKADLSVYGSIAAIEDQVYSGYQITPNVTVTCGGNLLSQGNNYTLTYQNNINVGTATVTATATSDSYYIGSVTGRFNISNTAGGMEITGYSSYYTYTGYAITPNVIVTMNGRMLTNGSDYTVTYSNNINVGTATMTVTGIGSYSGTKTINYTIEAKNIENCLTTAVDNYQYTGNTYTPNVTITDSTTGKTLAAGTDYTITYSNNKNPGTATITVTALSKNYTGSKVISFRIASAAVSGLRTSTIKNNSIKLAWSAQDYADGYQICNSSNRVVATTTKNSYTVKGLTSCTTYKFKVRSYVENADGSISYGSFSTAVSAKTLLNTPTLKAKSTKKGKVTLTWTKVSKATGYEIYYSTKKDGIYTRLKTISKSSTRKYVDSGLASGEKYYYTIRAYRTTNGVKTYSNYNTIKSVKVK